MVHACGMGPTVCALLGGRVWRCLKGDAVLWLGPGALLSTSFKEERGWAVQDKGDTGGRGLCFTFPADRESLYQVGPRAQGDQTEGPECREVGCNMEKALCPGEGGKGGTNTARRSSPAPPPHSALWLERPQNVLQLCPTQYPQCQEGRAAPGLAWLQTSATWLLGSQGWGEGSGGQVRVAQLVGPGLPGQRHGWAGIQ